MALLEAAATFYEHVIAWQAVWVRANRADNSRILTQPSQGGVRRLHTAEEEAHITTASCVIGWFQ